MGLCDRSQRATAEQIEGAPETRDSRIEGRGRVRDGVWEERGELEPLGGRTCRELRWGRGRNGPFLWDLLGLWFCADFQGQWLK